LFTFWELSEALDLASGAQARHHPQNALPPTPSRDQFTAGDHNQHSGRDHVELAKINFADLGLVKASGAEFRRFPD